MSIDGGWEPLRQPVTIVISADETRAEITIEGGTQIVTGRAPKETRRDALDVATRYALRMGRPVRVHARDANGEWRLVVTPGGVVRAESEEAPAARPGKRTSGTGRGRKAARVAVGGVLAVAIVAGIGVAALRFWPDTTVTPGDGADPAATLDTRSAPPGYGPEAAWRLPMEPGSHPAVSPDSDRLGYIDPDGRLVVAGPDGAPEWSDDLPFPVEDIDGPPQFVRDGGDYGVALVTSDGTLWQWPADGEGAPEEYDVPGGLSVTFAGSSALVANDERAFVPVDGELEPVAMEGEAGPLIADGERVLTAELRAAPWIWATPEGETSEVEPDTPPKADDIDEILTARTDYVIVRWNAQKGDGAVLAVHDSVDGSVVASTALDPDELDGARWIQGETAAAYGPVLVDLEDGTAETVEGFAPVSAAGGTIYGEVGGVPVAAGPGQDPVDLDEDAARPWGLLNGHAIVVADGHLYALSPH
ncbi:hypothetical protein [Allosalinactinospora lopnorensis]|uniref:hypothetical protein n=1 Tax=Allosalinactinospora lopnorensis TaxID=1352348 RepID=UPI000623D8C8|nr:hypothetical protein [Allosalinactinospora lopnorensis]